MDLTGTTPLLIWHDVETSHIAAYQDWHDTEHLPERVSIKGFRQGFRYRRVGDGPQQFLVLYIVDSLAVLTGTEYQNHLDAPTPLTREIQRHFQNFLRSAFTVAHSDALGVGGYLVSLRIRAARRSDDVAANVHETLPTQWTGIGLHILVSAPEATRYQAVEHQLRDNQASDCDVVVLAEASSVNGATAALTALDDHVKRIPDASVTASGIYSMAVQESSRPAPPT
jgi:hypothetical protein